jgi:DNA-binding MarR family transcriptional regulator
MADLDTQQAALVALKIVKANERLSGDYAALFKEHGLSSPQYNVLRILRGARDEQLSCHEVGQRLITRVPDVTRLLDRLEQRGLIERWRCQDDRRVVRTRITPDGLALLERLDTPLQQVVSRQFEGFSDRQLAQLDRLLEALLAT